MFHIPYKFYIENYKDLENLLSARGFKIDVMNTNVFKRTDKIKGELQIFAIEGNLFDENDNLIYYKPEEWKDDIVSLKNESLNDDLPF